jgi:hypothetical protein
MPLKFPNSALPLNEELVDKVTATGVHGTTPSISQLNEMYATVVRLLHADGEYQPVCFGARLYCKLLLERDKRIEEGTSDFNL